MSRTWRNRTNSPKKRPRLAYKHEPAYRPLPLLRVPLCFITAKPKVCHTQEAAAAYQAQQGAQGKALRVYRCGAHYHLTSHV